MADPRIDEARHQKNLYARRALKAEQQLEELLAAVEDLAAYLRAKPHDPAGRLYATAKRIREGQK